MMTCTKLNSERKILMSHGSKYSHRTDGFHPVHSTFQSFNITFTVNMKTLDRGSFSSRKLRDGSHFGSCIFQVTKIVLISSFVDLVI